jgi:hypothetical protein
VTALAQEKARRFEQWKHKSFTLAAGFKAFKGGRAVLNSSGTVQPATSAPGNVSFGMFDETVDATSGALPVSIDLEVEIQVERFVNATSTDAIAATDVGSMAYMVDDQTVGILPQLAGVGRSIAGRILDVDATKGIAIEKLYAQPRNAPPLIASIPAYTANNSSPATLVNGAVYDVPTQGAASTITLPAAAPDGTTVTFVADGVKNGFTTVYTDATGSVALNTIAQTPASKRHLAVCTKSVGKWSVNVFASP